MKRYALIAALAFAIIAGCNQDPFTRDIVMLERAWVAAFELTSSSDDLDKTITSLSRLKQRITIFSVAYKTSLKENVTLRDALVQAEDLVTAALSDAAVGMIPEAHQKVEQIRELVADIREELKLPQDIMDYYADYRETLTLIEAALSDGRIDDTELEVLKRLTPEARERWGRIEKFELDTDLYKFEDFSMAGYQNALKSEADALQWLRNAAFAGDRDKAAQAISELRAPYRRAFRTLGDFSGVK